MSNQRKRQVARQRQLARRRQLITTLVAVLLLVAAGITGYVVYQHQQPDHTGAIPAVADSAAPDDARNGVTVGTGPVKLDIYLDFMCPHCKEFETAAGATLAQLVKDNKVTIAYHPVAFLDDVSSTRYSSRASAASACAADASRFVEYATVLYARQPAEGSAGLTDATLIELAGTAGIDTTTFGQCVNSGRYAGWVADVTQAAAKHNVNGTPTVLVKGRSVNPTVAAITAAVDA
jgi:protein-disulfide isomerase